MGPLVREAYREYQPPVNVAKTIRILLETVPPNHLAGLREIVLTNASGLSRERRRQKTVSGSYSQHTTGLYHQSWQGQPAWIEIFVDNALQGWPSRLINVPLIQDVAFAGVLYHELGHHIQHTGKFRLTEQEKFAEQWAGTLTRAFIRTRYWYLRPLRFVLQLGLTLGRGVSRLLRRSRRRLQESCVEGHHEHNVPAGTRLDPLLHPLPEPHPPRRTRSDYDPVDRGEDELD